MDAIRIAQQDFNYVYAKYLQVINTLQLNTWEHFVLDVLICLVVIGFGYFNYILLMNSFDQFKLLAYGEIDYPTPKYFLKT